jgi:hypothetical protein
MRLPVYSAQLSALVPIIGPFATLRKATIHVRVEKLGSYWTEFREI